MAARLERLIEHKKMLRAKIQLLSLISVLVLALGLDAQNWTQAILTIPNSDSCAAYLYKLTEEPHVAATEEDLGTAEYVQHKFTSNGLPAEMATYDAYLPYPVAIAYKLLRPVIASGPTAPRGYTLDKDSYASNVVPPFNAYSPSGEFHGQVIYVNYGREEDYSRLETLGISVHGKIVMARYGQIYRGLKAKNAEDRGAAGLILYTDPADAGYMQGDIFPQGPYMPRFGAERGSIQYSFIHPGDPLTPGYPALSAAKRILPDAAKNLPRICALPLSWGDAERILQNLAGPNVPRGWQGGLPFAYHLGPGPAELRVKIEMDYKIRPIWNVVARIPGRGEPQKLIILGCHRDAWVYGAVQPSSGTAVMIEVARVFSELMKRGWRPRRTILFASWDAGAYGQIGSTEWVEDHLQGLAANCMAYINLDAAVSGSRFRAQASPAFKKLIRDVMKAVVDPLTGKDYLSQTREDQQEEYASVMQAFNGRAEPTRLNELSIDNLAGETDCAAFFAHAGVPCVSMQLSGPNGVANSIYDNFFWMSEFGDPQFLNHKVMAQLTALLLYKLSSEAILPYTLSEFAGELGKSARELNRKLRRMKAPVGTRMDDIVAKCTEWGRVSSVLAARMKTIAGMDARNVNTQLMKIERAFIAGRGLPGRPWYRNLLFAPDFRNSSSALVYPGIQYYVDRRAWSETASEIERVLAAIDTAIRLSRHLAETIVSE